MNRMKTSLFMALTALMAALLAVAAVFRPEATRRVALSIIDDVRPDSWIYQLRRPDGR